MRKSIYSIKLQKIYSNYKSNYIPHGTIRCDWCDDRDPPCLNKDAKQF